MSIIDNHYNVVSVSKFGENPNVSTASSLIAPQDIWTGGGAYPFPSAMGIMTVVSTSDEDKAGGTGASQIEVYILNDSFEPSNYTITLNGLTPVVTSIEYFRSNRGYIIGIVGSAGTNVGDISISHATAGVTSIIPARQGQTLQAVYTVPTGMNGYLQQVTGRIEGNNNVLVVLSLFQRKNLGSDAGGWRRKRHGNASLNKDFIDIVNNKGNEVSGGDDLRLSAVSSSANNVSVDGTFDLILFET